MLDWTDSLLLGHPDIDRDHRDAVRMMNQIAAAEDGAVAALFAEFVLHMQEHFAYENGLMQTTAFPAQRCHEAEHVRVLGLLDAIAAQVARGDLAAARRFCTDAGPAWFLDHRQTMDHVTVSWATARSS